MNGPGMNGGSLPGGDPFDHRHQQQHHQQLQHHQYLQHQQPTPSTTPAPQTTAPPARAPARKKTSRRRTGASSPKRRCVSTACIACRKRKSKCDGALPSCAACASVYGTECIYDPNSDHRRKGVYKDKVDSMKAQSSTLQTLVEAILNHTEEEAFSIVKSIRTCDSLDTVAQQILNHEFEEGDNNSIITHDFTDPDDDDGMERTGDSVGGERELARKMGELRLDNGSVRYFGGTSHLIYLGDPSEDINEEPHPEELAAGHDPITTWTRVTDDISLINHLMDKYFHYHYPYFTTLSRKMFDRDYRAGRSGLSRRGTVYCSSLLVNAMLALGCHFTDIPGAYGTPGDSRTKGDHFFNEAKRLIVENSEYEKPRLVTVQALALMSVREAGCAREARGWVYSGMSFRMAQDIGLNLEASGLDKDQMTDHEIDARRITFWGCFLFDKCWSNYMGRLPLLPQNNSTVSKFDVFPDEDAEIWRPFPDSGFDDTLAQPSRTRAAALQMARLCEISSDLLIFFYHPSHIGRSSSKAAELKKLSELHRRLEAWRKELPKEFEPKDGQLPNVILMHMFFHLQYIHLFRPFLKYAPSASPLPSHVSPRRICTANAGAISKLMRLYKKMYNLRQICNIAVYMTHSACTIHLLNLPEKTARRDITHGLKHLEEIAEDWLCARRTLVILSVLARKWSCELPEEAAFVLHRADEKYGYYSTSEVPSPKSQLTTSSPATTDRDSASRSSSAIPQGQQSQNSPHSQQQQQQQHIQMSQNMGLPVTGSSLGMNPIAATIQPMGPATAGSFRPPQSQPQPPHMQQPQQRQPMMQQANPDGSFTRPDTFDFWNQPQGRVPMTGFPATFAPVNLKVEAPTTSAPPPQTTQRTSPVGVSLGGSEYFLSDSARWQQSFDMWADGNADLSSDGGSGTFVFGQGRDGSSSVDSGRVQQSQQQQQQQQQQQLWNDSGENLSGFETLNMSLNGGFYLQGLD